MLALRQKELRKCGISAAQAAVLLYAQSAGESATIAEVARRIFRKPHTISQLVSRMEEEGLVNKDVDLVRKNRVIIALTEEGRKAFYQSTKRKSIHKVMSCLSEEEKQQLGSSLHKLQDMALQSLSKSTS